MVPKAWRLSATLQQHLGLALLSLPLGLIFMGIVPPATPGLDPSWTIALSKAHAEGLMWGKDIIFTFGALGYLFFGSLVDESFWEMQAARFLLFFVWIWVSLAFSLKMPSNYLKLASLFILIVLPTIFNTPETKFILLTLFILLDVSKPKQTQSQISNLKHYGYGAIAIFFLLIKFNFGLLSALSLMVTLPIKSWIEKRIGDDLAFSYSIRSVPWLLFGVFSGLLVFFSPLIQLSPFLALLIVGLVGAVAALSPRPINRPGMTIGAIAMWSLAIGLFTALNPSLREFIIGSLQISSGYSQSMTLVGPQNEIFISVGILCLIVMVAGLTVLTNLRNLGVACAVLLFSLMSFKHGFIRQGPHVLNFAVMAPAYLLLLGSLAFSSRNKQTTPAKLLWILALTFSVTFFLGLGAPGSSLSKYYRLDLYQYLSGFRIESVRDRFLSLLHPQPVQNHLLTLKSKTLASSRIRSPRLRSRLQGKTVDVIPWEVSLVEANQLKWHPAPIFQAYSAYTRWLDHKNLRSYQTDPPDRILYSFNAIDGRYPYFEQPQTTLYTLCHYRPLRAGQILPSDGTGEFAALRRRDTPICALENTVPVGQTVALQWREKVDLESIRQLYGEEPGNLLLLKADIQYSFLGKLYNAVFRTPPLYIHFFFDTPQPESHRLVLDTAKSGLLVGSLPADLKGALADFEGYDSGRKARAIAFSTSNPNVFAKAINVSFVRIKKQISLPQDFNPQQYLERNPDVKKAGVDAKEHFLQYGFFEGRKYQ
jgi:hypothetical protein